MRRARSSADMNTYTPGSMDSDDDDEEDGAHTVSGSLATRSRSRLAAPRLNANEATVLLQKCKSKKLKYATRKPTSSPKTGAHSLFADRFNKISASLLSLSYGKRK